MFKRLCMGLLILGLVFSSQAVPFQAGELAWQTALLPHDPAVMFIENIGQFDSRARFQVRGLSQVTWLAEDAIWLTILEPVTESSRGDDTSGNLSSISLEPLRFTSGRGIHLKLSFQGANPHSFLEPVKRLETYFSYFLGDDPARWRAAAPAWGGVRYRDLYPGVDLELGAAGGQLALRLAAQPGIDAARALNAVRLGVKGAEGAILDGDDLVLVTPVGEARLPLLQLVGFQGLDLPEPGISQEGAGGFTVVSPFARASATASEIVYDEPASLLYATFLGGNGEEFGYDLAVDSGGNAYLAGMTTSTNFPTTPGAFDLSPDGPGDVFVAKLNPAGSALLYATYLGGNSDDFAAGIALHSDGDIILTGGTYSVDFPATPNAFNTSLKGDLDGFVTRLNAAGSNLVYSSYFGGISVDYPAEIALDGTGAAYVTGYTWSMSSFPTTPGAFNTKFNGGRTDGFVIKFTPDGSALAYGTFLGGGFDTSRIDDELISIAVDANGAAYVTGQTWTTNYPTTQGAFDTTANGCTDAVVTKLNPAGSVLEYSTYLGGSGTCGMEGEGFDGGNGIALDSSGAAYVIGGTNSSDFPSTPSAFNPDLNGYVDAFIVKLNPSGSQLDYATFLGGTGYERGMEIVVDSSGAAYAIGVTTSHQFPTTPWAFDWTHNGLHDTFMVKFNATGSELLYATYLGGLYTDYGFDIGLAPDGAAILSGWTESVNFPVTASAFDPTPNGGACDVFVARLRPLNPITEGVDLYVQAPESIGVEPGGVLALPITYGNQGATTAVSPVLTATLSGGLGYLGDTLGITPTVMGDSLTWSLPELSYPVETQFHLQLEVSSGTALGARYPIVLHIGSPGKDEFTENNTAYLEVIAANLVFLPQVRR